jgi:very-short-patch-repair endonuclease
MGQGRERPAFIAVGNGATKEKRDLAYELRRRMTPEETMLWERLRANRLNGLHVRRQVVIEGYIVDFYCHGARLVKEVDGPVHEGRRSYDGARDSALAARGLTVLRVSNDQVRANVEGVLARIVSAAGSPLPVSGRGRGRGTVEG